MVSVTLLLALSFTCAVVHVAHCGDPIPERPCATVYSKADFGGESFILNDFDQSVNFKREYRASIQGWADAGSAKVEKDCTMTAYTEANFLGLCSNHTTAVASLSPAVRSVYCSCERTCSCDDISTAMINCSPGKFGRAYLKGGCDKCNAEYVELSDRADSLEYSPEAFLLYNGATVNVKGGSSETFNSKDATVYRNLQSNVKSYEASCTPVEPKAALPEFKNYLSISKLPVKPDKLEKMLLSNETLAKHPGILAVSQSVKNKRSSRYALILYIGDNRLKMFGFPYCKDADPSKIGEYRIPVGVDSLGIFSEIRIITVPNEMINFADKLNEYLSKDKSLDGVIPNAIIFNHFNDHITRNGSISQGKLLALNELRRRLIDENYTNAIFHFAAMHEVWSEETAKQPERILAEFEKKVRNKLPFLKPFAYSISDQSSYKSPLRSVNGYVRLKNQELWPKNLETGLINICAKAGDPLGVAILKSYFRDNWTPHDSIKQSFFTKGDGDGTDDGSGVDGDGSGGKGQDKSGSAGNGNCECESLRKEMEKKVKELKSKVVDERTERVGDADKILEMVWKKLMTKWTAAF